MHKFQIGTYRKATFGDGRLTIIAGPCVVESAEHALFMAKACVRSADAAELDYVFKASYDKANRTSHASFRGPGMKAGLDALMRVREELGVPILTDVHDVSQVEAAAEVADILQIPAFLSRQTDLIVAAVKTGRGINIKKGQFLAPHDARNIIDKAKSAGGEKILITERGVSFGYNNLVVDMRTFPIMRKFDVPVIFDVTHSLQLPGGLGSASGGEPEFIEPLARAAVACGIDGIFMETHDRPAEALSDGANALPLERFEPLLRVLKRLHTIINSPAPGDCPAGI